MIRYVKFRQLWDCCWERETHVIMFDNGSLHAVCGGCASRYTGRVFPLRMHDRTPTVSVRKTYSYPSAKMPRPRIRYVRPVSNREAGK